MRKILLAGAFLMIVASDWAWTKNSKTQKESFIPKSFSATFVQEYKTKVGKKKIKRSDGKLDYEFPSNIRFEMKGKSDVIFVSNLKKSWYYRPPLIEGEPGQLQMGKSSDYNLAHFFDILKNGLKSNEDYKVKKEGEKYKIIFSKESYKKLNIKEATLFFSKKGNQFKNLAKIDLIRKRKKKVSMIFSKIETNKKFATKHFHFVPPIKNVRISN